MTYTTLYRPVGKTELALIEAADWKAFPPRLDWQPIFYPVMNAEYAAQIAQEWNTVDPFSGYCGFVLEFQVNNDFLKDYPVQNVGAPHHNELWIPAEKLSQMNDAILGQIRVIASFYGEKYTT
jgi:hypothetical protein